MIWARLGKLSLLLNKAGGLKEICFYFYFLVPKSKLYITGYIITIHFLKFSHSYEVRSYYVHFTVGKSEAQRNSLTYKESIRGHPWDLNASLFIPYTFSPLFWAVVLFYDPSHVNLKEFSRSWLLLLLSAFQTGC